MKKKGNKSEEAQEQSHTCSVVFLCCVLSIFKKYLFG
jgi:hypothetical protein